MLKPKEETYHIGTGEVHSIKALAAAFDHPSVNIVKKRIRNFVCDM